MLLRWQQVSSPEGVVLTHLVSQIAPETTSFYLDTDFLFEETYQI